MYVYSMRNRVNTSLEIETVRSRWPCAYSSSDSRSPSCCRAPKACKDSGYCGSTVTGLSTTTHACIFTCSISAEVAHCTLPSFCPFLALDHTFKHHLSSSTCLTDLHPMLSHFMYRSGPNISVFMKTPESRKWPYVAWAMRFPDGLPSVVQ